MACSRERELSILELELQHFWRMNLAGRTLLRTNPRAPALVEIHDEVDLLAEMTDSPRIRELCRRYLRFDDQVRLPTAGTGTA